MTSHKTNNQQTHHIKKRIKTCPLQHTHTHWSYHLHFKKKNKRNLKVVSGPLYSSRPKCHLSLGFQTPRTLGGGETRPHRFMIHEILPWLGTDKGSKPEDTTETPKFGNKNNSPELFCYMKLKRQHKGFCF